MPGRPKFMAKRLYKLMQEHRAVGERLFALRPAQYADDRPVKDSIGAAWRNAADSSVAAFHALAELSLLLDRKAGVGLPA